MPTLRLSVERILVRRILALPESWLRRWVGPPRTLGDEVLDLRVQALMALNALGGIPPIHQSTVAAARSGLLATAPVAEAPLPDLEVTQVRLGGIPARSFRPTGLGARAPALLYLHGGGFVIGSPESHHGTCAALAAAAGAVVFSLDYRLAPEHPAPAAAEDAVAGFRALVAAAAELGIDPRRVAVGGDSAGGNLSAVVALQAARDPIPPCFQLLIYPATDLTYDYPSVAALGEGYLLTAADLEWFTVRYLPDRAMARDPALSPAHAPDLRGLPPALIQTGGFDPLRDDGLRYAARLEEAGVAVAHLHYSGLIHGWLHMTGVVPAAAQAVADAALALRRRYFALSGEGP